MPLIAAAILYGGTFFGYAGHVTISERVQAANQVQQHWLQLKHSNIDKVAFETLRDRGTM